MCIPVSKKASGIGCPGVSYRKLQATPYGGRANLCSPERSLHSQVLSISLVLSALFLGHGLSLKLDLTDLARMANQCHLT